MSKPAVARVELSGEKWTEYMECECPPWFGFMV